MTFVLLLLRPQPLPPIPRKKDCHFFRCGCFVRSFYSVVLAVVLASFSCLQAQAPSSPVKQVPANNDSSYIVTLNALARNYWSIHPDSALSVGRRALKLAQIRRITTEELKALHIVADAARRLDIFSEAIHTYSMLLERAKTLNATPYIGRALSGIALTYHKRGQLDTALEYHLQHLKFLERIGDSSIAQAFVNISDLYNVQRRYNLALDYVRRGLQQQSGRPLSSTALLYGNGAESFAGLRQFDSALDYSSRSLKAAQQSSLPNILATTFTQRGNIYAALGQWNNALTAYLSAAQIERNTGKEQPSADILNGLAAVALAQKRYEQALDYGNRALSSAQLISQFERQRALATIAEAFAGLGKPQAAFDALKAQKAVEDSIEERTSDERIAELQAKFDNERTTREVQFLQREQLSARSLQNALIIGSVAITLGALWTLVLYRREHRSKALIRSHQQALKEIQRASKIHSFEFDTATKTFFWRDDNGTIRESSYTTMNTITGQIATMAPEDAPRFATLLESIVSERASQSPIECTYTTPSTQPQDEPQNELQNAPRSELHYVLCKAWPEFNSAGEVTRVVGFTQDISDLKATQARLMLSEQKLKAMFDSSSDAYILIGLEHELLAFNKAASNAYSHIFRGELVIGSNVENLLRPMFQEGFRRGMARSMAGETVRVERSYIPPRTQDLLWLEATYIPVRSDDGTMFGVSLVVSNITARKEAEQNLLISERKLKAFFNSSSDMYVLVSQNYQVIAFNTAAAQAAQTIGKTLTIGSDVRENFVLPEQAENFEEHFAQALSGRGHTGEIPFPFTPRRPNTWISLKYQPVYDEREDIVAVAVTIADITARKIAEQERIISERKLKALFNSSTDSYFLLGLSHEILAANSRAMSRVREITGKEIVIGQDILSYFLPGTEEPFRLNFLKALRGELIDYEVSTVLPDGQTIWALVRLLPVYDERERLFGVSYNVTNITERKHAEERILASEKQLRGVVMNIAGAVYRCASDNDFTCLYVSENFEQLSGYTPEEFTHNAQRSLASIIHPYDKERVENAIRISLDEEDVYECEYRIITKYGATRWVFDRGRGTYTATGQLQYLDGVMLDINTRKQAEERLRESEQFLNAILNAIPNPIFVKNRAHQWLLLNDANVRLIGAPREELIGKTDYDFFPKEQADMFWAGDERAFEDGATTDEEDITVGGETRTIITQKTVSRTAQGGQYLVGVITDITARKRVEEEIRKGRALLEQAQIIAKISNWEYVPSIDKLYFNHIAQRMMGLHPDDEKILAMSAQEFMRNFVHREDRQQLSATFLAAVEAAHAEHLFECEYRFVKPDGTVHNLYLRIRVQGDGILYGVTQDVTERKHFEEVLVQAKNEAESANRLKSEFLANMSHEIRTPMNAILGFAELLRSQNLEAKHLSYLSGIISAGRGLLSIINDILDLSRIEAGQMELEFEPVDVRLLCSDLASIFTVRAQDSSLTFATRLSPLLPQSLLLDEARLRQSLFNLIGNAIKFTPNGSVTLSVEVHTPEIFSIEEETIGLAFTVEDTGIGIPRDQHEFIFAPFTQQEGDSTRRFGGTGLGLSITRRLVEMMGGFIRLESEVGKGSAFSIVLPHVAVADSTLPAAAHEVTSQVISFAPATILVADDTETNRAIIRGFLEPYSDLTIIEAIDGEEAVYMARRFQPALILMDIQMPVVSGLEAIERLRADATLSSIPIITISASVMPEDVEKVQDLSDGSLSKPLSKHRLVELLAEHLPKHSPQNALVTTTAEIALEEAFYDIRSECSAELITMLETSIFQQWVFISLTMSNLDIEAFATTLAHLAEEREATTLHRYATMLYSYSSSFKIVEMNRLFYHFPVLIGRPVMLDP